VEEKKATLTTMRAFFLKGRIETAAATLAPPQGVVFGEKPSGEEERIPHQGNQ